MIICGCYSSFSSGWLWAPKGVKNFMLNSLITKANLKLSLTLNNATLWPIQTGYCTHFALAVPFGAFPIHIRAINIVLNETMTIIVQQLVTSWRCRVLDFAIIIQSATFQKCWLTFWQASFNGVSTTERRQKTLIVTQIVFDIDNGKVKGMLLHCY